MKGNLLDSIILQFNDPYMESYIYSKSDLRFASTSNPPPLKYELVDIYHT